MVAGCGAQAEFPDGRSSVTTGQQQHAQVVVAVGVTCCCTSSVAPGAHGTNRAAAPAVALLAIGVLDSVAAIRPWPLPVVGLLDEPGHLLTAWLVLAASPGMRRRLDPGWVLPTRSRSTSTTCRCIRRERWPVRRAGGRSPTRC